MPFDWCLFAGGLQQHGKCLKESRGHKVYGIATYSSLVPILGEQWHVRALNKEKYFSYAILGTVQFYLHRRRPADQICPR